MVDAASEDTLSKKPYYLELTKRGAGMATLFLLVTGVCQSLNELGVVSVTKKWSGQNRTSRTACYGPVHCFREDNVNKTHPTAVLKNIVAYVSYQLPWKASHSSSLQEILQLFA